MTIRLPSTLAFTAACLLLVEIPLIILYLGTIVSVGGGSAVWGQTKALIPGLGVAALMAVLLAAIGLLLASLTGRRAYATGIDRDLLLPDLDTGHDPGQRRLSRRPAPARTRARTGPGHALVAASFPLGARLPGLISPFTVIDGVRQWLGGTNPGPIPNPGSAGVAYGLMFVLLLAISLGGLAARYRKVGAS